MSTLHNGMCGVQCGGDVIPGLLFPDDTSLVASNEDGLRRAWIHWLSGVLNGG